MKLTQVTETRKYRHHAAEVFLVVLPLYKGFSVLQVPALVARLIPGLAISSLPRPVHSSKCTFVKKSVMTVLQPSLGYCCAGEHVYRNVSACSQTVAAHPSLLLIATGHDY